jgi:hypothetical protein
MTVEEHGGGRQMFRYRLSPRSTGLARFAILSPTVLAVGAALDGAWSIAAILGTLVAFLFSYSVVECSSAMAVVLKAVERAHGQGDAVRTRKTANELDALRVQTVALGPSSKP